MIKTLALWAVVAGGSTAQAQDAAKAPPPQPQTVSDPRVPLDQLNVLLVPLTKAELEIEVGGWIGLVRVKAGEIAKSEVAVKTLKPDAADTKTALLENLNKLRDERAGLVDRTRVAMMALETKGGKVDDQEKYLAAVSGLNMDVKDANAALAAITGWLKSKEGGLRWLKNFIFFALTLGAFRILASVVGHTVKKAVSMAKTGSGLLQDFLVNSARKIILLIGAVIALSMLEVNIGPLVAAIGAIGFVIGFALQGTLSNFAAGIMILLYRPYDLGDTVTVAGTTGKVDSMTLVSTTLHSADNRKVVVPNGSIWGTAIQRHL